MKFNYKISDGKAYIIPRINKYDELFAQFSKKLIQVKEIIPTIDYMYDSYFEQPKIEIDPKHPEKMTLILPAFFEGKGKDLCEQLIKFYSNIASNSVKSETQSKSDENEKEKEKMRRIFSQNEGKNSYMICTKATHDNQNIIVDNIFDFWLIIFRNLYISKDSFYISFKEYAAPKSQKGFTIETIAASSNDFCKIYKKKCNTNKQYDRIFKSVLGFTIDEVNKFQCTDESVEDYAYLVYQIYSNSDCNYQDYFLRLIKIHHQRLTQLINQRLTQLINEVNSDKVNSKEEEIRMHRELALNVCSIENTNDGRIRIKLKFDQMNPWHSIKVYTRNEESGTYRLDAQLDYLPKAITENDLNNGIYHFYDVPTGYAIISIDTKYFSAKKSLEWDSVICSLLFIPKNFTGCFPRDIPNNYQIFPVVYDASKKDWIKEIFKDIKHSRAGNSEILSYSYKESIQRKYIVENGIWIDSENHPGNKNNSNDVSDQPSQGNDQLDLKTLNIEVDSGVENDKAVISRASEQSSENQMIKIPYGTFLSAPQSWFGIDDLKNMFLADRNMDENDFKMNILRLFPDIIPIRYFSKEGSKSLTFVDSFNLDSSALLHELTGIPFIPTISGSIFVASNYKYIGQNTIEDVEAMPVMYVKMFNENETEEPKKIIANTILSMAFSSNVLVINVNQDITFISGFKELLDNLDDYMKIMKEYPDDEIIDMICDHIIILTKTPRKLMEDLKLYEDKKIDDSTPKNKLISVLNKAISILNPDLKDTITTIKEKLRSSKSRAAKFNLYNMREAGVLFTYPLYQPIKTYYEKFFQDLTTKYLYLDKCD